MNGIFGEVLMYVCCAGIVLCGLAIFAVKVFVPFWEVVRRYLKLPRIQQVLVAVFVLGMIQYGATKQGWHISFDGGIKQGAQSSLVTNDTIFISWQRDTSGGTYVPESAAVYIDYRPNTETNADWGLLAQTTVGAWSWTGTVPNATNYDYNVWAYYIPPEPVHTNGVWVYKTLKDRAGKFPIPLRARIEVNGQAIATPAEKRKDIMRHIWKIAPYFYGYKTNDTFPDDAEWFYEHTDSYGHCSAMVKDGCLYRNYDWTLDFAAEFLVVTEASKDHFKSIGIGCVGDRLTEEFVESGEWDRHYFCVPGHMLDGVNENGVVAEINVTSTDGVSGWNANGTVNCLGAVRWVLDHGTNAQQAAQFLAANVKRPAKMNFHYIVADIDETWVVENGVAHMMSGTAVMTNFDLFNNPSRNGEGVERYDILAAGGTMADVLWTRAYSNDTNWISDFNGSSALMSAAKLAWAVGTKEQHRGVKVGDVSWWQTLHSAKYDIGAKSVQVSVQETGEIHTFNLNEE